MIEKLDYRCTGNYCLQATRCRRFLTGPEAKNCPVPFAAFDMRDTVECDGFLQRLDVGGVVDNAALTGGEGVRVEGTVIHGD
jgi:hypothetical protein